VRARACNEPGRARWAVTAAVAALLALVTAPAAARAEVYLRVIAQRAPVHTGPGPEYREVYYAARGELLSVLERGTTGYWYRVELADGTTGWIFGELVFPFEEEARVPSGFFGRLWHGFEQAALGPPAVGRADVEVSFSVGVLGGEGMYLLRPAWLVDRYFALEAFAGLNARAQTDVFLGGLGWTLRMLPGAALGPYVNAGMGAARIRPKADNFTETGQTLMAVNAGGGVELTFKKQITLRLDFRNWTLFDENQAANAQEYTGGLAIFF
jgi:uncharacterized protein YraI